MPFQNFLPCLLVDARPWAAHLFLLSPSYRFKEISNNYNHLAFLEPWEQGAFTDIVITLSILPLLHMAGEPVDQVLQELNLKQANSLRYFKFREILGLKIRNPACSWLIKNLVHFFGYNHVVKSGCTNQKVCLFEIPSFCCIITKKKMINKFKKTIWLLQGEDGHKIGYQIQNNLEGGCLSEGCSSVFSSTPSYYRKN